MRRGERSETRKQVAPVSPKSSDHRNASSKDGWRGLLLAIVLVAVTFIAYEPAWHGKPIWDDLNYLTPPSLSSWEGLAKIWIVPGATPQYYPLVYSLFWLEHALWRDFYTGYHLVNIFLHVSTGLLLYRILKALNIGGAWLATAIFTLHPVQVESVAWISEAKNALSGVLYVSSALAYCKFRFDKRTVFYFLSLALFVLGLLAKTVIAPLPAALLVVLWWKHGRLTWKDDVAPLLPFFVCAIVAGLITRWMEQTFVGAVGAAFKISPLERIGIAAHAVWFYISKLLWPQNLSFSYPRWPVPMGWTQTVSILSLLLLGVALWMLRNRSRSPFAALLLFTGTLFPALGFIDVYPMRFSFVADHFQYLACIAPIALFSSLLVAAVERTSLRPAPSALLLCAAPVLLALLTHQQSAMYEDLPTLWDTTLKRNPDSILALNNRGYAFMRDGKLDAASRDFEKALTVNPEYEEGHNNLGTVLLEKGSINAALDHFETAIRIRPTYVDPYVNRGRAHFELGAVAEAVADFKKAIELAPNDANAHYNLGAIYRQEGRVADAIAELTKSSQIRSGADVYYQLGAAYRQAGRTKESIDELRQALAIDPAFQDAREELAIALFETDQTEAGARELRDVLIARPQDSLRILNNVTWSLATGPHANEKTAEIALTLADRARAAGAPNDPLLLRAMAAAYARLGRFSDAVSTIHKALSSTPTSSDLAKTLHEELQQYEQGAHHRN